MTLLFYYLLKVTLCSGLLFVYYHLALKNHFFHQWNRFYLLSAVALSILLPALHITLFPAGEQDNKAIQLIQVVQSADHYLEEFTISNHPAVSPERWLTIAYLTVSAALLFSLCYSLLKIFSLVRRYHSMWLDKIRFINTTEPGTPFSFFHYIFWNEAIPLQTETGQQIFQHELVHVHEKHTLDKLFMQVVLLLFWCNPFFWMMRRELRFIHEFIADKRSVGHRRTADFAAMIMQTIYPRQYHSIINPFFQTSIKRRLLMLTKIEHPRKAYFSRIIVLPVVAITVILFSFRTRQNLHPGNTSGLIQNRENINQLYRQLVDSPPQKNRVSIDSFQIFNSGDRQPLDVLKALTIVDGKEYSDGMKTIDPNDISSMNILKGQPAIDKYGEKGRNGVVEITMKQGHDNSPTVELKIPQLVNGKEIESIDFNSNKRVTLVNYTDGSCEVMTEAEAQQKGLLNNTYSNTTLNSNSIRIEKPAMLTLKEPATKRGLIDIAPEPIYIIDGKEIKGSVLSQLNPKNISSMNVLKGEQAITKYGDKGRNGVVEIFMKKPGDSDSITVKQNDKTTMIGDITNYKKNGNNINATVTFIDANPNHVEPILNQTEIEASVDIKEWRAFLEKNLTPVMNLAVSKGIKPGTYTAYVRFLVKKDGSTSGYQITKDPGYSLGNEILKIMPNGPRWKPALQNNLPVNSYHTQPVNFIIQEQ